MDSLEDYFNSFNFNISFNISQLENFTLDDNDGNCDEQCGERYMQALISHYLMGITGLVFCCLGIFGNTLSVIVLSRRSMRSSSTYVYMIGLAICDTLVLICTVMVVFKDSVHPSKIGSDSHELLNRVYVYMFPYAHGFAYTFMVTSIWLTLAFTVDRYIMICHPFKAEYMCTVNKAKIVIIALYIGGILFNIPKFLEYKLLSISVPNRTLYFTDWTELGQSQVYKQVYHSWLYFIFVWGIPFVTLAILNAFLMHAVRQSRKKGKQLNIQEKKRNDTTVMLIGVVVIFFICQVPALISRMVYAFHSSLSWRTSGYALNEVANFLVVLNSAINIVPYYFFGKKFRREFWRTFCIHICTQETLRRFSKTLTYSLAEGALTRRESVWSEAENNCNLQLPDKTKGLKPKKKSPNDFRKASCGSCNSNTPLTIQNQQSKVALIQYQPSYQEVNGNCSDKNVIACGPNGNTPNHVIYENDENESML
ncbi:unnamed protein product [Owenia fusiformis]|uniref:Uncharacterized protein n=1 Tax=Owenia fusiformis TaxID=6347 RepID=A0A8J1T6S5_OWEFU|nr:unnamed protein product [Owenia fusiformis]